MPQKTRFLPAKNEQTAFFYAKRGTQRERSPSPCGGVRVTPSPERLARPSGVVVPENTDLSVFKKSIPGRSWDEDRRKRNELLSAYSFGKDRGIAAQLRSLITEMKVFAEEADKNVAHSRGVGIEVQGKVRDPWPFTRFDAWLSAGKKNEVQRKGLEGMYLNAHFDRKLTKKERNQRILTQRYGPVIGLAPIKVTDRANEGTKKMPLKCEKKKSEWMNVENGKHVPAKALKIMAETIITPIGYSPIKTVSKPALRSAQPYLAESTKKMETSYAIVNGKTVTEDSAKSENNLPWVTSNGWAGVNYVENEFAVKT
ncbi:hypothetical protein niasHS_009533 [Heterodera schachtii]|uniref:Uncharacterized protein n=1 Tax=Heterodera schachtii TaxID=97005 RepID=A0ABD2JC82_HETSC